jgi:heptosyltransferase II
LVFWFLVSSPVSVSKLMVRATNWIGDAVMSLPAIRALRERLPAAEIAVVARPWVADVYAHEPTISRLIPYTARSLREKLRFARQLRAERFDSAVLLQNAFDAALMAWLARIPERIGYDRDARGWLLTRAVPVPEPGEIPRHERYYYLELLRRAGILETLPAVDRIRLEWTGREACPAIGISPGAAFGSAKRWLPERFAEVAAAVAIPHGASVLVFGSAAEEPLATTVAERLAALGVPVANLAGRTSLREFIDLASGCRLFLSNDSGAMHIASALGVPTVTVFGPTDDTTTGPTGPLARVVREPVWCSPCQLRECPLDHRCMRRVEAQRVAEVALALWQETAACHA